jgi:hypothetical protein
MLRKLENSVPRSSGDIEGMKEEILSEICCTGQHKKWRYEE